MDKKTTRGDRVKDSAILGGLGGVIHGAMSGPNLKKWLLQAGLGATMGAGAQAIGDSVTGDPESVSGQFGSGAVGGGILGGLGGLLATGSKPGGSALARYIAQQGKMSPKAVMALMLGGGTLGGAGIGALGRGVDSAALQWGRERNTKE